MFRMIFAALVAASPALAGVTEVYKSLRGDSDVNVASPVRLDRLDRLVPLSVRVTWPAGEGTFPLVVFSQGALCPKNMYAAVTDHWTSHGYVTIAPFHIDSESNGFGFRDLAGKDLVGERIKDMIYILDALDVIEDAVPGLSGKIDRDHIAAAGHSFGGQIALAMTGLETTDATTQELIDVADERYDVAVVLSGVGPLPNIAEGAFSRYTGPVYSSGGTKDLGATGGPTVYPWPWRMAAYFDTPPGDTITAD
jgi:pimeloyl-ACP methyl ester carboxylesterase